MCIACSYPKRAKSETDPALHRQSFSSILPYHEPANSYFWLAHNVVPSLAVMQKSHISNKLTRHKTTQTAICHRPVTCRCSIAPHCHLAAKIGDRPSAVCRRVRPRGVAKSRPAAGAERCDGAEGGMVTSRHSLPDHLDDAAVVQAGVHLTVVANAEREHRVADLRRKYNM